MNAHVEDGLLRRFVAGEVDEETAVRVAHHLDACPRCAARADALDPLASAFSAMEVPEVPAGLVERVLVAATPASVSWRGAALGAAMLLVASVLFSVTFDPLGGVGQALDIARSFPTISGWVGSGGLQILGLILAFGLFAAGTGVAVLVSSRRTS